MSITNDYNDGSGNARITILPDHGGIGDANPGTLSGGHVGGLYSGGQPLSERGKDTTVRAIARPPTLGGGFTACTPDGFPIASADELRPDSVITLPDGTQTAWEVARTTGLVSPEALQQAQQEHDQSDTERQEQSDKAEATEPMAPEAEAIMREVIAKAEGAAIGAMVDVIQNDGALSAANVEELASVLQVEPSVVQQRAQVALKGYEDDANRGAARAANTDEALASEALQDARLNRRSDLRAAAERHFFDGVTSQYGGMVADYIGGLAATNPSRVLSAETGAGISVRQDGQGEVIVTIDGASYRYEDAVAQRLIVVTSGQKRP